MCQFKSALVLPSEDIVHSPFTDSHEDLIDIQGLIDDAVTGARFVRIEFSPNPDHPDEYADLSKYKLKVDQHDVPDWWTPELRERTAERMREIVKPSLVTSYRNCLVGGCYILAGNARIDHLSFARIIAMLDSSQVVAMDNASQVEIMCGGSTIEQMNGSSYIGRMRHTSHIGSIYSGYVSEMINQSSIEAMYYLSQVAIMRHSSYIDKMYSSSRVKLMFDSSYVKEMLGHSYVQGLRNSSYVEYAQQGSCVGIVEDGAMIVNDNRSLG